jgi:FlaA1/EpsC-like NDP-sugar epimerase
MASRKRTRKFWKSVFIMFIIYLIIVTGVYLIFDYNSAVYRFRKDPFLFAIAIAGISFAASFSIAYWLKRDPELRGW